IVTCKEKGRLSRKQASLRARCRRRKPTLLRMTARSSQRLRHGPRKRRAHSHIGEKICNATSEPQSSASLPSLVSILFPFGRGTVLLGVDSLKSAINLIPFMLASHAYPLSIIGYSPILS